MKKYLFIVSIFSFLFFSCDDCTKKDLDNPATIKFKGKITVLDSNSSPVEGTDVGFILQKNFCDGDYGLAVPIFGKTNALGEYRLKWQDEYYFPYVYGNEEEYIRATIVLGTNNDQQEIKFANYYYYDVPTRTGEIEMEHTFNIN